jgi:RimJ/RimL family protein N-acetyltransferase
MSEENLAPPELIELGEDGLQLRRLLPGHAEAIHGAIKAGFAEIHAWMPWCQDPVEIEEQREFLDRARLGWAERTSFNWGLFDAAQDYLGTISLETRQGPGVLEIGYWLRTDATGKGLMTRAAARLTGLALGMAGIDRVEIHCDAANERSAAIPIRLGFRLERIEEDLVPNAPKETGRSIIWVTP